MTIYLALCCIYHPCNEQNYISCVMWRERFSASPRVNRRLLCTFQSKLFAASTAVEKSQCEVMNFAKTARLRLLKRARVGNKSRRDCPACIQQISAAHSKIFPAGNSKSGVAKKALTLFLLAHPPAPL